MNENISNLKIKYIDNSTENIDNPDNALDISCDMCLRCIYINQYKKKGVTGQIVSRIILFEGGIKEIEVTRS